MWFGDIKTLCPAASIQIKHQFDTPVSGLGWLPNGSLLVVLPLEQKLIEINQDNQQIIYANLQGSDQVISNDLWVSAQGTAFVSGMGNNYLKGEPATPCSILRISPERHEICTGASDLLCPNGFAYDAEHQRLYVAESQADRISCFRLNNDGILSDHFIYYQFNESDSPDGIALDHTGALWVACNAHQLVEIRQGKVTQNILFKEHPLACAVGGDQYEWLFVLTTHSFDPEEVKRERSGKIYKMPIK